jgi:hypothetical protein
MDTDDLSKETYQGILVTAEKFHHDLTLQFGILAAHCKNDNDYLDKAAIKIGKWLIHKDLDVIIPCIFFDNYPTKEQLGKVLSEILSNIERVKEIPIEQREFEVW